MKTIAAILLSIAIAGSAVQAIEPAPPDATTLSLRGTLQQYDATTRTLTLTTRSGPVVVMLLATTRVRHGRREIDAVALEKLTGYHAVVRYSESAGRKILQSIHVLEKSDQPWKYTRCRSIPRPAGRPRQRVEDVAWRRFCSRKDVAVWSGAGAIPPHFGRASHPSVLSIRVNRRGTAPALSLGVLQHI